jgi:uncharacterized membrane protein YgaE (UPF0421/DUF939 family)
MLRNLFTSHLSLQARLIIAFKMIVGFVVTILICELLNLEYSFTAGAIAVIGINLTRRKIVQSTIIWLLDSLLAIGLAVLLFYLFGYDFWVLIVFVVIFLPLSFIFKLKEGIVIALVLISQIYIEHDPFYSLNALYILLISIVVSFLLNLYVPRTDRSINESIKNIDRTIDDLIQKIAHNDPVDFMPIKTMIKDVKDKLFLDLENHYFVQTSQREDYIKMRRGQLIVLERIAPILHNISDIPQKMVIIDYLKSFKEKIGTENYANDLRQQLHQLIDDFKKSTLPKDSKEFKNHAELFHVLLQLDEFLDLKIKYHELY